jgi:hypothetical protein
MLFNPICAAEQIASTSLVVWLSGARIDQTRRIDAAQIEKSIIFCDSYKNVASVSTLFVRLTDLKV